MSSLRKAPVIRRGDRLAPAFFLSAAPIDREMKDLSEVLLSFLSVRRNATDFGLPV